MCLIFVSVVKRFFKMKLFILLFLAAFMEIIGADYRDDLRRIMLARRERKQEVCQLFLEV